jgi:L-aspartate oxidase
MRTHKVQVADFVVLGGGIAGIRAAIDLARHGRVLVLTKGELYESNTEQAQGGIAAALAEDDEVRLHLNDTLLAGDGLCSEEAVRLLVEEGPHQIQQLIEWGMRFDRNGTKLAFTREGAHSRCRVLHAQGDSTGAQIIRALMAKAKQLPEIRLHPHAFAIDLLMEGTRAAGVQYLNEKKSSLETVRAGAVLLATGGLGQAYRETTNPSVATGDGVAMAYRSGALLSDLEFIQFHPTALYVRGAPRFLLSEALRGEGAVLRNILLERFMPRHHDAAELAPRDVVSRAIVMEMHRTRSQFVYLDLTELDAEHVKKRFPNIYSTCLRYNLDITSDLIPVQPAAHYSMGGVATNLNGATSVQGLFAAGEVAATGVHGANRLASNSLLEGLVFGARSAAAMAGVHSTRQSGPQRPAETTPPARAGSGAHEAKPTAETDKLAAEVRSILWNKVGILRNGRDMGEAVIRLNEILADSTCSSNRQTREFQNIATVACLIAKCAAARQESRGAHYRTDNPLKDESQPPRHSFVSIDREPFFAQHMPETACAA